VVAREVDGKGFQLESPLSAGQSARALGVAGFHSQNRLIRRALWTASAPFRRCRSQLALQKESPFEEGQLIVNYVHTMIAAPPTYAVSRAIGYIKRNSAIQLARMFGERRRNFVGQHFCAWGYFALTVDRDEAAVRASHQGAGTGGSALGATEPLALIATDRCLSPPGPRQRSLQPL
jgi:REP element-mobilizing transposase RayT